MKNFKVFLFFLFAFAQQVFPERKIIQINPLAINRGGGGIHCTTQQQPKLKKEN